FVSGYYKLWCLDAATGSTRWRWCFHEPAPHPLASAGGLLYTADGGSSYALDVGTGALAWRALLEEEYSGRLRSLYEPVRPIAVAGDDLYHGFGIFADISGRTYDPGIWVQRLCA